ncbi:MAG TPA: hypothetical protein VH762_11430 [Gemmatimonadaceae bacterium]
MKKAMLLAAFVVACGKSETPAADSPAVAAGPAPLMAADVAGTWNGTTMAEASDSVIRRWTVMGDGMTGKWVVEGSKDTVTTTTTYDADSMIVTSSAYKEPTVAGNPMVTFRSVGRLTGGRLVGTAAVMPVSKPDSVIVRFRWEATKAP